jgi:hypothetical protein
MHEALIRPFPYGLPATIARCVVSHLWSRENLRSRECRVRAVEPLTSGSPHLVVIVKAAKDPGMEPSSADPSLRKWVRYWTKVLVASCVGMAVFVLIILWVLNGFHGLGLQPAIAVALLLGTVLATAVGVALMGLIFYSDRAGIDESTGGTPTKTPPR